ncbi:MAG: hypothetical protein ACNA7G_00680 [Methylobacter sp.]
MLKSYEAIYDHGHIKWLGEVPKFKCVRVVLVADDADELEDVPATEEMPNGVRLVGILRATPAELRANIAEKFGNPVDWQREQRKDRLLSGREDD